MHILLITQHFAPETGATPNRMVSFVDAFEQAGHDVTVVAAKPNHPEAVIWEEYRGGLFEKRSRGETPVVHTWVYARPEKTFAQRMGTYLSFAGMAPVGALRHAAPYDVVVVTSPPLFSALAGWAAARLRGVPFVLDVRDLWPEVVFAVGALAEGSPAGAVARGLERFVYRTADAVAAVTESFCRHIRKDVRPGTPVRRVMNGTTPEVFAQQERRGPLRRALGMEDQFVVMYAGNLGLAQGLAHILEAAARLREDPAVRFVFLGSGPVEEKLRARAEEQALPNVQFLPRMALPEAAAHMSAADALLVPLARHDLYQEFIPSKLFDGMACGRPILLSVDGEARAILDRAEGGLYYRAEDGAALAERVRWMKAHRDEARAMGRRGRAFVREHGTRQSQAQEMIRLLEEVTPA